MWTGHCLANCIGIFIKPYEKGKKKDKNKNKKVSFFYLLSQYPRISIVSPQEPHKMEENPIYIYILVDVENTVCNLVDVETKSHVQTYM